MTNKNLIKTNLLKKYIRDVNDYSISPKYIKALNDLLEYEINKSINRMLSNKRKTLMSRDL